MLSLISIAWLIGQRHDVAKPGEYRNVQGPPHSECFLKLLEGGVVLLCQRLIDLNCFEPVAIVVHGDGHIDPPAETVLLHGLSNLILQLGEGARNSDGYFQEPMVHRADLHGDPRLFGRVIFLAISGHTSNHRASFPSQWQSVYKEHCRHFGVRARQTYRPCRSSRCEPSVHWSSGSNC